MGVPYVMFKILGCSKMFYGWPDPIQIQLFIFKNEYDPAFGHSNEYRYNFWRGQMVWGEFVKVTPESQIKQIEKKTL